MVFSSLVFLCVFFQTFLAAYFLFPRRRTLILVIFSLIFYAFGEPVYILALLLSGIVNYLLGLAIGSRQGTTACRTTFIIALIFNLGLLCAFKYTGFIVGILNVLFAAQLSVPEISLPIGISFYTFQAASYIIDIYRGKIKPQSSLLKFLSYITMFPQLVAGPIVRYSDIQKQLIQPRINTRSFSAGVTRFAVGLGKKVLLAYSASNAVSNLFNPDANLTVLGCWLGLLFFSFQIYFDFSGYSDMAIGLGRMIGFRFRENFNYPYTARSVTDFWRRWHISLSSFFREYVYIPMGGNKRRQLTNIIVVWGLTGLWHGASWNFIIWGLYYGLLLVIEKKLLLRLLDRLPACTGHAYTLTMILCGWILFYFTSGAKQLEVVQAALGVGVESYDIRAVSVLGMNAFLLPVFIIGCTALPRKILRSLKKRDPSGLLEPIGNTVIMAASFAALIGQSYSPFLYFRF